MISEGKGEKRYELREGPLFLSSVYRRIGAVHEWDEVRLLLDMTLATDPTNPSLSTEIGLNLWFTEFGMPFGLALIYEVRETERIVVYEAIVEPP